MTIFLTRYSDDDFMDVSYYFHNGKITYMHKKSQIACHLLVYARVVTLWWIIRSLKAYKGEIGK